MRLWSLQDTSDSELVMGMFRVFVIDDQAWNFDSEKVKSDLWNKFKLQSGAFCWNIL